MMTNETEKNTYLNNSCKGIDGISIITPYQVLDNEVFAEIKCIGQHIAFPAIRNIQPFNGVRCDFTEDTMNELERWVKAVKKEFKKRRRDGLL